jgi:hypothetical protein
MAAKCKTCGEPIEWVTTERGARMPLNPEPDPAGYIILVESEDGEEVAHQLHRGEDPSDVNRYIPHFATCGRAACACAGKEPSSSPNEVVLAIDRWIETFDHHAARVLDELQSIAGSLGDIVDRLGLRQ